MTHAKLKISIAALIIIGAIGYLGVAGIRGGWVYYVDVDDFLANVEYQDKRVRLCGKTDQEVFEVAAARLTASFQLNGLTGSVPVVYHGAIPSTLTPGCEVVVEGRRNEAGTFEADQLMTKCASKYEAEDHANRLRENKEAQH